MENSEIMSAISRFKESADMDFYCDEIDKALAETLKIIGKGSFNELSIEEKGDLAKQSRASLENKISMIKAFGGKIVAIPGDGNVKHITEREELIKTLFYTWEEFKWRFPDQYRILVTTGNCNEISDYYQKLIVKSSGYKLVYAKTE
jgi:hypothetical protein